MPSVPASTPRRYLMCEPRYFDVRYAINPWMSTEVPVDHGRALAQWQSLADTYRSLGHTVEALEPLPDLPDMVFAANGAVCMGGRVFGARFHAPERRPEAAAHQAWFKDAGFEILDPQYVCEGEGDLVPVGRMLLAGTGFRTTLAAHQEAQEYLGFPTVSLHLTDPYFYHLDTALFALDDENVAYYPGAFSPGSRETLARLYPDAVIATREDALAFGLNSVSDGLNVIVSPGATGLIDSLAERGYHPISVDLSELHKAGGSAKCCTQEVRSA